jgi:hypothetical protein
MAQLPRIITERLKNRVNSSEYHPDANLLSAFVERSLADKDRSQVLGHLARCSQCQDVIALATPGALLTQDVFRPVFASRFSWPVLRWGAAIACVVVVGAAVTLHLRKEVDQTHSGEGTPAALSIATVNSRPGVHNDGTASGSLESTGTKLESMVPQHAPSQSTHTLAQIPSFDLIPGRAKDDVSNSGAAVSETVNAVQPLTGSMSLPVGAAPIITSPGAPRWALTADGSLQRSFDMGRTWEPVTVSVETSLRAVSASGFDIWVGGTNGALYHSDDAGDHWVKIQPIAEGQSLTSDIIGVEFPDIESGRLSTASGDVWTTRDGGSTWRVRPLRPTASARVR